MQVVGPGPAAPSTPELIKLCEDSITKAMTEELADTSDQDRYYLLQEIYRNHLYYRDLQNAYQVTTSVTNYTSSGPTANGLSGLEGETQYDYSQNIYRGYARKLEAVLGNRMPNATARPNNDSDTASMRAVESANNAALYVREKCDLQIKNLYLVWGLYNFGTNFYHIDWVIDGDTYGYKSQQIIDEDKQALGNASFDCPQCTQAHPVEDPENQQAPAQCSSCGAAMNETNFRPPTEVSVPKTTIVQIPKGGLEITLHNGSEIAVPMDCTSVNHPSCVWLDYSRENHKGAILKKWERPDGTNPLREEDFKEAPAVEGQSGQYAESVRSAMISPIGLARPKRPNYWTERDVWWTPAMYEVVDKKDIRAALKQNFPKGLRISMVKGKIIDLKEEKLSAHWQECKPEPSARIMADPLGNDWIEPQDLTNNMLNQRVETVERCNRPGFADPRYIDTDAYQERRTLPEEIFPMLKPAGGTLADAMYFPEPAQFSAQIGPFTQEIETRAQSISGELPDIWGGGEDEPTARQAELKKNAALMQLGVIWTMIGRSLEQVYLKAVKLLADSEDGIISFSKKNEFQQYKTLAIVMDDLKNGQYHFEADEAIPMQWGQQRDLLMWLLDKPANLLTKLGFDDPFNVVELKSLLGMPGERIPLYDNLKKAMGILDQLMSEKPVPGQVDPTSGQPGAPQASIQPDWEDDPSFNATLVKAWLQQNPMLKQDNPDGYQNVLLYGQACESKANAPAPPPPAKASVALSLKGNDLGSPAVQDALQKAGLIDQGTNVAAITPPLKPGEVNPQTGQQVPAAPQVMPMAAPMPPPAAPTSPALQ